MYGSMRVIVHDAFFSFILFVMAGIQPDLWLPWLKKRNKSCQGSPSDPAREVPLLVTSFGFDARGQSDQRVQRMFCRRSADRRLRGYTHDPRGNVLSESTQKHHSDPYTTNDRIHRDGKCSCTGEVPSESSDGIVACSYRQL